MFVLPLIDRLIHPSIFYILFSYAGPLGSGTHPRSSGCKAGKSTNPSQGTHSPIDTPASPTVETPRWHGEIIQSRNRDLNPDLQRCETNCATMPPSPCPALPCHSNKLVPFSFNSKWHPYSTFSSRDIADPVPHTCSPAALHAIWAKFTNTGLGT